MAKTNPWKAMAIVGLIIIITSIIDGFTGWVANIPIIGGLFTSIGNSTMEILDILLGAYLLQLGVRK